MSLAGLLDGMLQEAAIHVLHDIPCGVLESDPQRMNGSFACQTGHARQGMGGHMLAVSVGSAHVGSVRRVSILLTKWSEHCQRN